jgi:hypothetical protein
MDIKRLRTKLVTDRNKAFLHSHSCFKIHKILCRMFIVTLILCIDLRYQIVRLQNTEPRVEQRKAPWICTSQNENIYFLSVSWIRCHPLREYIATFRLKVLFIRSL